MAQNDPRGRDAAAQRRAALAVLAARPADLAAWLRLAYADRLDHGRLTDEGRRALEMSYLVQPYAGRQTPWRLGFALDNWSQLTPQTRQDAVREMQIVRYSGGGTVYAAQIQSAGRRAADPGGRLAAALVLGS